MSFGSSSQLGFVVVISSLGFFAGVEEEDIVCGVLKLKQRGKNMCHIDTRFQLDFTLVFGHVNNLLLINKICLIKVNAFDSNLSIIPLVLFY
jgi:hypothetical protein